MSSVIKKSDFFELFGSSKHISYSNSSGVVQFLLNPNINVNSINIAGSPSSDTHAATVGYVKNFAQGMDVKESVKCATIVNIVDLSGLIQVDNIIVQIGDRVLVKNQNIESQNGIYVVHNGKWSRAQDFDEPHEVQGAFVFVEQGTTNAAKGFIQLSNAPVSIGNDPLKFTQFNGTYAFNSGDGLTQDGNTLNVDASLNHVTNMTGLTVIGSSDLTTSVYSNLTVAYGKVAHLGGRLDVCGNMIVDGTSNLMSDLTVANGKVTHLGGRLDVCGNMVVDGTSNLMSDVTIANGKVTHLGGRLDVCGNMVVDGTSNLMNDVTVASGKSTQLGGRLDVCGNMVVDGTSNLMNDVTVASGKSTQLGGRLDVCGNMVVDGTLDISSNLIGLNVNNKGTDSGLLVMRKDASNVLIGWDETEEKFVLGLTNAINSATSEVGIVTKGVLLADLSGNAETATNATNSEAVTVDISGELFVKDGANNINVNRGSYSSKLIIDPSGNLIINIDKWFFRYDLTSASDSYNGVGSTI